MPADAKPRIVCLVGPTAAGKTAVALQLAARLPFEIVSVDSAMVYRYMNIGTAKPSPEVLAAAPHRLVDIMDPWETYSAGRFRRDALNAIDAIVAAGRVPLLVGGTFLYFRALERGLAALPAADAAVRAEIDARAAVEGWPAQHARLARLDPPTAARIGPNDRQRIQRALEVIELSGRRLSELRRTAAGTAPDYEYLRLALVPSERKVLHARIARRFDRMLADGFVAEVERLRAMTHMNADRPSMRAVGYRQLWAHLDGQFDRAEAARRAVVATRRLVKRQLTWLRGESGMVEFDCLRDNVVDRVVQRVAGYLRA